MDPKLAYRAGLAVLLTLVVGASQATVAHFAVASSTLYLASNGNGGRENVVDPFGLSASSSRAWAGASGALSGHSLADLPTGQLSARLELESLGFGYVDGSFSVAFADTFHVYKDGKPHEWSSEDTVTFTLDLSGVGFNQGSIDQGTSTFISAAPVGNLQGRYDMANDIPRAGDDWAGVRFDEGGYWLGPDYWYPGDHVPDLPAIRTFSFQPGQDFSWIARLRAGANSYNVPVNANIGSAFADFLVRVSYEGPPGTTTYSASGVFPGTLAGPVPEPGSLALIGAGLAIVGWRARRRPSLHHSAVAGPKNSYRACPSGTPRADRWRFTKAMKGLGPRK